MDIVTLIVGGALLLMVGTFALRLFYIIVLNLIKGRKFHQALEKEFDRLRLSNMLRALGINKSQYIHTTSNIEIKKQMENCQQCSNTDECDTKLSQGEVEIDSIDFCNNEAQLKDIKISAD